MSTEERAAPLKPEYQETEAKAALRTNFIASKSARRTKIVDTIVDALTHRDIYNTMGYDKKESVVKQYMHRYLKDAVHGLIRELHPNLGDKGMARRLEKSVLWESDKQTTINHERVLGAQHRPDFLVKVDGLRFAVEIKRGRNGSSVREGIGQSLVYALAYDFVIYIFVDTDRSKNIRDSLSGPQERFLVDKLWTDFNVRFKVV